MNILLTSAGRRTYLCDYFKEALGDRGLVFACNSTLSPASENADRFAVSPLIYSDDYIPFLLKLCRDHGISLLVPLFDIDLPVIAANRALFEREGVCAAVSEPEVIACCNDKLGMAERLSEAGIAVPKTVTAEDLHTGKDPEVEFPCIVKPRYGMGSISILKAYGPVELAGAVSMCGRAVGETYLKYEAAGLKAGAEVIIQPVIRGVEYGLDVINDFDGNYVACIIRRKLSMRAGETDEAVIVGEGDPAYGVLRELGQKLSILLRHRGNLDVDVLLDGESRPFVIDMNARFGGGYPFSHGAGVRLPEAYICWAEGKIADKALFNAKPGVHGFKDMMVRCYSKETEPGGSGT